MSLLILLGCGQDAPPATVEGTLRLNGRPLDNCLITFLPEPEQDVIGPHSTGVTDASGYYRLRLADQREGASVGPHCVIVQDLSVSIGIRRRDNGTVDAEIDDTKAPPVRRSRIPANYGSSTATPLKKEIKKGPQVIDLDIR